MRAGALIPYEYNSCGPIILRISHSLWDSVTLLEFTGLTFVVVSLEMMMLCREFSTTNGGKEADDKAHSAVYT